MAPGLLWTMEDDTLGAPLCAVALSASSNSPASPWRVGGSWLWLEFPSMPGSAISRRALCMHPPLLAEVAPRSFQRCSLSTIRGAP